MGKAVMLLWEGRVVSHCGYNVIVLDKLSRKTGMVLVESVKTGTRMMVHRGELGPKVPRGRAMHR